MSCKSFSLFATLPPEIRAQIWELSVPFVNICLIPHRVKAAEESTEDRADKEAAGHNRHHSPGRTFAAVSNMLVNYDAYSCLSHFLRHTQESSSRPRTTTFETPFDLDVLSIGGDVVYLDLGNPDDIGPRDVEPADIKPEGIKPSRPSHFSWDKPDVSAYALSLSFLQDPDLYIFDEMPYIPGSRMFIIVNPEDCVATEKFWMYKPLSSYFSWDDTRCAYNFVQGDQNDYIEHGGAYLLMKEILCVDRRHDPLLNGSPREIRPAVAISYSEYGSAHRRIDAV